jgi:AcrR family transcriptional regulator
MGKRSNLRRGARKTQSERRAITRDRLLSAAANLICERGYAELTTTNIADRAGLTRGAVQYHFGNVDDVCLALVDDFGNRLAITRSESGPFYAADLENRVNAAVDFYWKNFSNSQYIAVMFIWLGFLNNKKLYSQLARRMKYFEQQFDREWQGRFRQTGVPNKRIAATRHIAISALRGFAIRSIYRRKASDWADEIEMLKRMILASMRPIS